MSTLLPTAIALIQKHSPSLAAIPWIKWVADSQAEIQVCIAAAFTSPLAVSGPNPRPQLSFASHT